MDEIRKYPRTHHIEGSRLQPGDEDLTSVPFSELEGRFVVVEEKVDGANCAVSFDDDGKAWLQSRGHYLTGGARARHFDLFKQWVHTHESFLHRLLGNRLILYGEWLYAKHTIYHDLLPHYFLEFDVLDRTTGRFLSTPARHGLLEGSPVVSVPVIRSGPVASHDDLVSLVQRSLYKSPTWQENLARAWAARHLARDRLWKETDPADLAEGLYIKVEQDRSGSCFSGLDSSGTE